MTGPPPRRWRDEPESDPFARLLRRLPAPTLSGVAEARVRVRLLAGERRPAGAGRRAWVFAAVLSALAIGVWIGGRLERPRALLVHATACTVAPLSRDGAALALVGPGEARAEADGSVTLLAGAR